MKAVIPRASGWKAEELCIHSTGSITRLGAQDYNAYVNLQLQYNVQSVHKVLLQLLTLITLDVNMIETHCERYIKA
jgi:hypothetical protein